ncbi:hypothetical protein FHS37_003298 [Streptomyces griseostramineus]|uniref:Uncharacterized protein n=1 Tax=Streptomyces griseomycini TaxID=66895 RepID=A0A7W7PRZ6_9ACTN|nr:hypothetical protein [Streptomyces griseomycini]MBB4899238.1 hypothetical protein [Streptomyces griseomycini]
MPGAARRGGEAGAGDGDDAGDALGEPDLAEDVAEDGAVDLGVGVDDEGVAGAGVVQGPLDDEVVAFAGVDGQDGVGQSRGRCDRADGGGHHADASLGAADQRHRALGRLLHLVGVGARREPRLDRRPWRLSGSPPAVKSRIPAA